MMNEVLNAIPPMIYIIIILIGFCALFGAAYYALKNGKLSSEALEVGTTMLEGMRQSAEALAKATGNGAISVAAFILDAGTRAAHAAEQMYKTGEIDKAERNKTAKKIAEDLLNLAGIDVTEDRKTALAVAIEAECDAMGHAMMISGTATLKGTPEEIKTMLTEEKKTETINAEVGSLARGYETPECQGDGKTYVCVEEEDGGFGWKQVTNCTDDELNTAIHAHLPKANYGDMTREDKISLIESLTEDKEQD